MRENTDQKKSAFRHISHSAWFIICPITKNTRAILCTKVRTSCRILSVLSWYNLSCPSSSRSTFCWKFFFRRCTVWCLCECSLNSFVFAIFHKNFHFFSGGLLSWRNWWQIMSKSTYRGDARRPTGHSNSFFLSEFRITVIFRSFLQRICFLIPKLTILSKPVSVDSAAVDSLYISLQTS